MPETWVTPRVWVAGERVGQSKMNEISQDFRVLYPMTAGGSLAFRSPAGNYLAELLKGAAYQGLMMKADATQPSWASLIHLLDRQGSSATNWQSQGVTQQLPSHAVLRGGSSTVTITSGSGSKVITYSSPFANRPLIFAPIINASSFLFTYSFANDSVSGVTFYFREVGSSSGTFDFNWFVVGPMA